MKSQYQVVRDVVRGDRPIGALAEVGVRLERTEEGHRVEIPAEFHVALPLVDLACGLLAMGARRMLLREWASTLVAISDIEFHGIDSDDGEALLDALWTAAAGGDMSERSLETARRLTE